MRKHFVLDTNILLHDPEAIFGFAEHDIWIPIVVIEEIDRFKKDSSELGRNARQVARHLDQLRLGGTLTEGVPKGPRGGVVRVILSQRKLPDGFALHDLADARILATALKVQDMFPEEACILVSLDTNMRIRANVLGLTAEDYDTHSIKVDNIYPSVQSLEISEDDMDPFFQTGELPLEAAKGHETSHENQYLMLKGGKKTALARVQKEKGRLVLCESFKRPIWGLRPRNREQCFALDACLRPDIHVVCLVGKAGTGKTLLALAAGLHQVTENKTYQKLLVSRPVIAMGRDIGFLPGAIEDKMTPWMQPIHDNVEYLFSLRGEHPKRGKEELMRSGTVEIEALTYIRGRTIAHQYMIVDEAQNLTPHETKTILTRAAEGTKIIFTGDPMQIDNPYVDSISNGLTYLLDRFRNQSLAASVVLLKGERSPLAELAANLL